MTVRVKCFSEEALFEAAWKEGKKNPMTEEEAEAFVEAARREKLYVLP